MRIVVVVAGCVLAVILWVSCITAWFMHNDHVALLLLILLLGVGEVVKTQLGKLIQEFKNV
jgi:hypothetical protein